MKKKRKEKGSLHDGVPATTVVLDGGWCKRSHKHSYNAKSGVEILIGQATGKILHMGVRNKYCSVCAVSEKKGELPPTRDCHRIGMGHPLPWKLISLSKDFNKQRLNMIPLLSVMGTVLCTPI